MKLRNGLIFLMILVLTAVYLPASADTTDFPFLPGLNWNSSLEEVENAVGIRGETDNDTIGNSGRMVFFKPENTGLAPVPYELGMTTSARGAISMLIFLYDISACADKDAARGQIFDEIEKLYGERGSVMFDTPESMQQAFAGKSGMDDAMQATALGGLEGAVNDMYGGLNLIVRTKAWLVDRKYAAMAAYSTSGSKGNQVSVIMVNIEETLSMMMDESLPEDRTGCFDLPAGASWMCSTAELDAALTGAGLSYTVEGDIYQVALMSGPEGNWMSTLYMFNSGRLMGTVYILGMDFDSLEQIMVREYGNKTDIDTNDIKQQVQSLMGITATRASVWIGTEVLNYLFESAQGCFVMQISARMLME